MAVYAVKWNLLHSRVFLSASADWSVRLWDGNRTQPVMTFDLDSPVGDVAWAPYSATVFAAVTDDGKVRPCSALCCSLAYNAAVQASGRVRLALPGISLCKQAAT